MASAAPPGGDVKRVGMPASSYLGRPWAPSERALTPGACLSSLGQRWLGGSGGDPAAPGGLASDRERAAPLLQKCLPACRAPVPGFSLARPPGPLIYRITGALWTRLLPASDASWHAGHLSGARLRAGEEEEEEEADRAISRSGGGGRIPGRAGGGAPPPPLLRCAARLRGTVLRREIPA